MKQRILTGSAILALLVLVLAARELTTYIFDGFWLVVSTICAFEMSELLRKMGLYNNKWFIMAYPALSYAIYMISLTKGIEMYLMFILQLSFLILYACLYAIICLFSKKNVENEIKTRRLAISPEKFAINKSIHTLFGMLYPTILMLMFILINHISLFNFTSIAGNENLMSRFLLIFAFTIPAFVDTFALLTGITFKGKKLCPKISPNKTISGAVGGLLWGTIASASLFLIFNSISAYNALFAAVNLSIWKVTIIGFVISILCQFGDIFESFLKRKAQTKDSGNILPGHGGALDRVDSHVVSALVVFIAFVIILA